MTSPAKAKSIDEYIARFPEAVQIIFEKVRQTIRAAAPDAQETIRYNMPTFTLKGDLIYLAAAKKHIGIYPTTAGMDQLQPELAQYKSGKVTLQFPLDKPIPYDFITKVVKIRVAENLADAEAKAKQG